MVNICFTGGYVRVRVPLFAHIRVRQHARALSISMPLPASCSSVRWTQAGLLRLHSALVGQTRRAGGGVLLLTPRAESISPPPVAVKLSGIPSVFGSGMRIGTGECPGDSYASYLFLSPFTHKGNNHTGWGQFGLFRCLIFLTEWLAQSAF